MLSEILLAQLAMTKGDGENISFYVSDINALEIGIDINDIRNRFYKEKGRNILTNENVKVLFEKEGRHLDFSTFDDVSIRVDFNAQKVAPNKGGDGFEN